MSSPLVNKYTGTISLLFAAALTWTSLGAQAQGAAAGPVRRPGVAQRAPQDGQLPANLPQELPGELVVRLAPGMTADALAAQHGLTIKRRLQFAPNTYIFKGTPATVAKVTGQIRSTPGVLKAVTNKLGRYTALPSIDSNDALRGEQWPLRVMGAPNFWGISVGERLVNGPVRNAKVGLLDTGILSSHPDLAANMDPNGWDFTLGQLHDPLDITWYTLEDHGTAMAGCMAAVTNNFEGIASLPWEGVSVVPCEIGDFLVSNNTTFILPSTGYAIDAIYYCIEQGVDVISMSFTVGQDDLLDQALQDAYDSGIVAVGASGNSRFFGTSFGVSYPANVDTVIAVGAVGPSGELAYYSDGGPELDVVAPGGNDSNFTDLTRQVLTTDASGFSPIFGFPPGYDYGQGTSQACAYTAGVVATLITQGARDEDLTPQEQVERIRQILEKTARNPLGRRTDDFGAGLINVAAALREITPVIDVAAPVPNEITASFGEPLQAVITRTQLTPANTGIPGDYVKEVVPLLDGDFDVFHNGVSILDSVEITDSLSGTIGYAPDSDTRYAIGNNRINIEVEHPLLADTQRSLEGPAVGRIPARVFQFRVQPRIEQPGLKLVSFPFELQEGDGLDDEGELRGPNTLSFLVGSNPFKVARWLTNQGRYAIWDTLGSPQEPEADLLPPPARDLDPNDPSDSQEIFDEVGVRRPPIGLGFWARVNSQTQLQIIGKSERSGSYEIKLQPGFNLIGNPYPFRVPWNVVSVRFGNELLSVQEASNRGLMRNTLWRWDGGRYRFDVLPHGQLREFEAHWVRAFRDVTLVVPRIAANFGTASAETSGTTLAGADGSGNGWTATLAAAVEGQDAGEIVVGARPMAGNGYGHEDIECPPPAPAQPQLTLSNRRWGKHSGNYVQDVRKTGQGVQHWIVEVETSRPSVPVKLSWNGFPRNAQARLMVNGKAGACSLTDQGSYQFTPARAGKHRIVISAVPFAS